ncbi:hypothetical protein Mapa_012807 [Marchantia paleacea]|nr:hypothetical protein Mapa_012807 [Marchantia paleacea]
MYFQFFKLLMVPTPCTAAFGMVYKIVVRNTRTPTNICRIHSWEKETERFGQYTSLGSGAHSVTHNMGFSACWLCAATAAPRLFLKVTIAAGISLFL